MQTSKIYEKNKTNIQLPKGWRFREFGEILQKGDRFIQNLDIRQYQNIELWSEIYTTVGSIFGIDDKDDPNFTRELIERDNVLVITQMPEIDQQAYDQYKKNITRVIVPEGFRIRNVAERITEGDKLTHTKLFEITEVQSWVNCKSSVDTFLGSRKGINKIYGGLDLYSLQVNGTVVITQEDVAGFATVRVQHRFKIGDKVKISHSTQHKNTIGIIDYLIQDKPQYFGVTFNKIPTIYHEQFLTLYVPIKIGDYEVENIEGGVKVGCTIVTDFQIKEVAKLRGII